MLGCCTTYTGKRLRIRGHAARSNANPQHAGANGASLGKVTMPSVLPKRSISSSTLSGGVRLQGLASLARTSKLLSSKLGQPLSVEVSVLSTDTPAAHIVCDMRRINFQGRNRLRRVSRCRKIEQRAVTAGPGPEYVMARFLSTVG